MPVSLYTPSELSEKYQLIRATVSDQDFFQKPRNQKMQELWCATQFAAGFQNTISPCNVWWSDRDEQTAADFELEAHGRRHPFQLTEVQSPGRRRGDEYRYEQEGPWSDSDWRKGAAEGKQWITAAIAKKASHYPDSSQLNLLVYVNFSAWNQEYIEICTAARDAAAPFFSVWLMTGTHFCCIRENVSLPPCSGWAAIASPE